MLKKVAKAYFNPNYGVSHTIYCNTLLITWWSDLFFNRTTRRKLQQWFRDLFSESVTMVYWSYEDYCPLKYYAVYCSI